MSTEREEFEAAVTSLYDHADLGKCADGIYANKLIGAAWWGWRHGRPEHHNAPADSGTHPHNDGLDDYREPKK